MSVQKCVDRVEEFLRSFSRHQLFNRGLPGLYCRPHEDRDHPDRKFEPFEFGDKIAESIKEVCLEVSKPHPESMSAFDGRSHLVFLHLQVVLTRDDGTLTGRIQFDPHTGWRTNFSATVVEIKPGVNSLNSIKEVDHFHRF